MRYFLVVVFTVLFNCLWTHACARKIIDGGNDHLVDVQLESTWLRTPFHLNLLETVSSLNESAYLSLVSNFLQIPLNNAAEEEFDDDDNLKVLSDSKLYEVSLDLVDKSDRRIMELYLANKFFTPRVQSHYQFFKSDVLPKYGEKLVEKCSGGNGEIPKSFVLFNDELYCSADDLFAIITDKKSQSDVILPFDRVIGDNEGPVLILYGTVDSSEFRKMFYNLYQFVQADKLRFIWRYLPQQQQEQRDQENFCYEELSGYGVDLTLKRTDYIVIDDRNNQRKASTDQIKGKISDNVVSKNFWEQYMEDIKPVSKIDDLDLKIADYVLNYSGNGTENYEILNILLQDFPKYASHLSELDTLDNDTVADLLESETVAPPGLYINGFPLDDFSLNLHGILKYVSKEASIIKYLMNLGLNPFQSKNLINSFAYHSLLKTKGSSSKKRYDIRDSQDVIIYVNDIEKDPMYANLKRTRKDYVTKQIQPGQVPNLKENVHDTVFIVSFSDPIQVYYFLQFSQMILQNMIPQQVGIIPLIKNERDLIITKQFLYLLHAEGLRQAFSYLQQVNEELMQSIQENGQLPLTDIIIENADIPEEFDEQLKKLLLANEKFLKKFSINKPQILVNGVFYSFGQQWQMYIATQIYLDVLKLSEALKNKEIRKTTPLKDFLFSDADKGRNTFIIPDSADAETPAIYKKLNFEEYQKLLEEDQIGQITSNIADESVLKTLWFIGDFESEKCLTQFLHLLKVITVTGNLKLNYINIGKGESIFNHFKEKYNTVGLEAEEYLIEQINSSQKDVNLSEIDPAKLSKIKKLYGLSTLLKEDSSYYVILNGRVLKINDETDILSFDDLELFINYEVDSRLGMIYDNLGQFDVEKNTGIEKYTWFELLSTQITKTYYKDDNDDEDSSIYFNSPIPRYDLSLIRENTIIPVRPYIENSLIDITVVIQPINELSQKLISLVKVFNSFDKDFLNIKIALKPLKTLENIEIKRFYRGVYQTGVNFDENGDYIYLNDENRGVFKQVPEKTLFTLDLDVPSSWIVTIKEAISDLDNVKLDNTGDVSGIYELKNILVEGHAREVSLNSKSGQPPTGLQVQLTQDELYSDTNVMANLGYLQLKANPGLWEFKLKPNTKTSSIYEIVDVDTTFISDIQEYEKVTSKDSVMFSILNLNGLTIYPVVKKKIGKESHSILSDEDDDIGIIEQGTNLFKRFFKSQDKPKAQAEINIFTVASGHLYERFLSIMTASVMKNTEHTVKFWLIENYMSPTFKKNLPILAENYGFEYELVTYKWPKWLRGQREKQRTIWGYKILFLDVLFPQDLQKVIFVDADQIVRTDLKELIDLDLEGAPYGYTPMCDSRKEMEGFRFWKQGYWDKVLGQNGLQYHISALYVIDLKRFRQLMAGDILRQHYQSLSADPSSLSNLDQDLPNNLQHRIKIFSLPQEWLWCETWCSDESLKVAKTIDLCNNPLTKEPKLDRARRQVPEWTSYDNEIFELLDHKQFKTDSKSKNEKTHDEL
ncbi:hypothetical protein PACTADRAFT_48743 [Pachysolen tannophilus NRRL Y-2460]|uniref:Glycosyltransferase family 24 protein n=1 Tax=Pachysolen tannophilus NRRL Y-2460 TaxID=669874 RepID=A0A1E4TYY7_PACTA|nr:hypothetical protein PACTADRAFT_48743 [Pachysolen tannophilus NRRL Y-2460]